MARQTKRYMLRFAYDLLSFRLPEFQSLASYFELEYTFVEPPTDKPFYIIETDNEERLLRLLNRSVLALNLYELWVCGTNGYEQFYDELSSCPSTRDQLYSACSFRILVETFGKKISLAQKVERIEKLDFLPFHGPINLTDPQVTFHYFEYYGHEKTPAPPEVPLQIIFGRWIADSSRKCISKFSLKRRKFIANTTMEPTLAFLMSNIAKIGPNDIVYDPFVGSGSLLVSAAFYGAFICGSDIDFLLLHALAKPSRCGVKQRDKDESVMANLKQYNLQSKYLDVICADSSLPLLKSGFQFDAIVTDPPYGKREARERIGTLKNDCAIPAELVAAHIPSKLQYEISAIYKDLMDFAAAHLRINGRILFWAPYSNANEDEIPDLKEKQWPEIDFFPDKPKTELEKELHERFRHPQLKFICYSKQDLTYKYCRILIAMERIC